MNSIFYVKDKKIAKFFILNNGQQFLGWLGDYRPQSPSDTNSSDATIQMIWLM